MGRLNFGVNVVDHPVATTTVTSSPNPSTLGQPVSFTADVSRIGVGEPDGTVQFAIDGAPLGEPVAVDACGQATSPAATPSGGSHTVTADYTPADPTTYSASTGSLTQSVGRVHPKMGARDAKLSQGLVVRASLFGVDGETPLVGKPITFSVGSKTLCTANTGADGSASCTPKAADIPAMLSAGKYVACFPGDSDYLSCSAVAKTLSL